VSSSSDEQLLRELRAEREIARVVQEYGRGVDEGDFERVRACFHEDATITYGSRKPGRRDEIVAWLEKVRPLIAGWHHYFGAPIVDLRLADGEGTADAQTWCINVLSYLPDDEGRAVQQIVGLLYTDRFELRDGAWRIASRRNEQEWGIDVPGSAGV
jgi:hypothetical protein